MTQAQQDAVSAAQQKFFAAVSANQSAQAAANSAAAAAQAAFANATVTVPAQCRQLQSDANMSYETAVSNQKIAIQTAHDAQDAQSAAQMALSQAISDSLQTGATEDVSHTSQPLTH